MRSDSRSTGFSLIETLIALALVTLGLFLTLSLAWQQPRLMSRLGAQQEALRLAEATIEAIRTGAVPLQTGPVAPTWPPSRADALILWLEVEPLEPSGLYSIAVEARYAVGQKAALSRIETMVWRRP